MGGPKEQLRQQESRPLDNSSKARLGMGSRTAQHFHRRNPSQHRVLASIIDDMNKDAGINKMVQLKSGGGRVTNVPVNIEAFQQMWISKQEYDESGPSIVHR